MGCMVILFKFWRNPCTFFHVFTFLRIYVHTGFSSLHSHQHGLFSGGFLFVCFGVCVCGLNTVCVYMWFKYSHPGGCDAVSPCGFDLFRSVTARSPLRCFCLHAASLPVSSPAAVDHPHEHHQQRVFPLGTSMWLPLHFTLFSPPFTRANETSASLSLNIDDF